jgi:hypothetical protein
MKIKTITTAWISNSCPLSPEQILNPTGEILLKATAFTDTDMSAVGWVKIGTATVEFDLISRNEMIDNKVVALQAEMQIVKADAQVKVQKLEDQLQSLLAIEVSK